MNIKSSVARYAMAMGINCRAPRQKLASGILLVGLCERSHSETLPTHLDISAVLTVTSGPDSHMMSKLDSLDTWRWSLMRLLPRVLAEWLFHVGSIAILC